MKTILAVGAMYVALISGALAQYDPSSIGEPMPEQPVPQPLQPVPVVPVPVPGPVPGAVPFPLPAPACGLGMVGGINVWPYVGALAIRTGPGVEYPQIGALLEGTTVRICGSFGSWGRLETGYWVSLNFVVPVQ